MTNVDGKVALKNSLGFTLLVWFLLLSVIPVSFISYKSYVSTVENIEASAARELKKYSLVNKKFIDNWFFYRKQDALRWSQSETTISFMQGLNNKHEKNQTVGEYLKSSVYKRLVSENEHDLLITSRHYSHLYDIFLIDKKGNILYTLKKEDDIGTNLIDGTYSNTKFAKTFKETLNDSLLHFSDLEKYAPSKDAVAGFITTPIVDKNGETIGVFAVQLNLERVFSIFDIFKGKDKKVYSSYLVGIDGLLRCDINKNAKALDFKVDTQQFFLWKQEHNYQANHYHDEDTEVVFEYKDPFGNDVIGVHMDINIYGVDWTLINEIKKDMVLSSANEHLTEVLVLLFIISIIVITIALVITSKITNPIRLLAAATVEIAKGNLDYKIKINSKNEIGILVQSFTDMTKSIKESNILLEAQKNKLLHIALHDELTGLRNRHYLRKIGDSQFASAKRHEENLSVIMCDIDYFKAINDNNGHLIGDKVLIAIANLINENKRAEDFCARYGGEEFVIVLQYCDINAAKDKAEEMRVALSKLDIDGICITASFGVAQINSEHKDFEALLNDADKALYRAKESGRNRVVVFE